MRQQSYRQILKEVAGYWGIHHATASRAPKRVGRKKWAMDINRNYIQGVGSLSKIENDSGLVGGTSDSGTIRWMESLMGNNLTANQDFFALPNCPSPTAGIPIANLPQLLSLGRVAGSFVF